MLIDRLKKILSTCYPIRYISIYGMINLLVIRE